MQSNFIQAIHNKRKIIVQFHSKEDEALLTRVCAPMDYGPSRKAKNKADRYHLWDYNSGTHQHTLSLLPEQVVSIETTGATFEPSEFINWDISQNPWYVKRDWGIYS